MITFPDGNAQLGGILSGIGTPSSGGEDRGQAGTARLGAPGSIASS